MYLSSQFSRQYTNVNLLAIISVKRKQYRWRQRRQQHPQSYGPEAKCLIVHIIAQVKLDQCLHLLDAEICRKSNCQESFKHKFVFTKVQAPGFENVSLSRGMVPCFNVSDDKPCLRCSLLLGLSHPAASCLPGDTSAAVHKTTPQADQGNCLEIKSKKNPYLPNTHLFISVANSNFN